MTRFQRHFGFRTNVPRRTIGPTDEPPYTMRHLPFWALVWRFLVWPWKADCNVIVAILGFMLELAQLVLIGFVLFGDMLLPQMLAYSCLVWFVNFAVFCMISTGPTKYSIRRK